MILSSLLGSPAFFDGLWQIPKDTRSRAELRNEIKDNEKVMKVNYFLGTEVVIVFSHPLFLP